MKQEVIIVVSFIILLGLCIGGIEFVRSLTIMSDTNYQKQITQIYNAGVDDALYQIILLASKCEPIPLSFQNETINLIAIECLNNGEQNG